MTPKPLPAPIIDFQKLADAKIFYTSHGFTELAVPWIIDFDAYNATRPPDRKEFYALGGYLNASGEQSFLDMMIDGQKLTKHFCVTPCFRDDDIDEYHHTYFMKLELIDTNVSEENLQNIISTARQFLASYLPTKIIQTSESSYDIIDEKFGIELGSYGIRTFKNFSWIYGTGIALPRIDTIISHY